MARRYSQVDRPYLRGRRLNRRISEQEFISRASAASPGVIPIGPYLGYSKRVRSRCKSCDYVWEPIGGQLLRGVGCPKCARNARLTIKELQLRVQKNHPQIEIFGEYINQDSRINCACGICGYEWSTSAASLSNGSGCPKCSGNLKRDTQSFKEELSTVNSNIKVLGEYANSKTPISVKCCICNWEWDAVPDSLITGHGCPNCAGRPTKDTEYFKKELGEKRHDVSLIGDYINVHTKSLFRCNICGSEWMAEPNGILNRGSGCPKCSAKRGAATRKKPHDSFVRELERIDASIEVVGTYETVHKKIEFRCKRCGRIWLAEPNSVLNSGTGCPSCNSSATSYAEQFIRFAFEETLGKDNVRSRDRNAIGLELDIYLPAQHFAIEYGAWYWHKERIDKDQEKIGLCEEKGITLAVIYDGYPKDDPPMERSLVFRENLGDPESRMQLLKLTMQLIEMSGNVCDISDYAWNAIHRKAKAASRRISSKEFKERIASISPDIEVIGEYAGDKGHVEVRCKRCGHNWAPIGGSLVRGQGCPICAKQKALNTRRVKSAEKFLEQMNAMHPNIYLLGEYKSSRDAINCKCKSCGAIWTTNPIELISKNRGCPECDC